MQTVIYQIEFFTYWHTSSGLSGSAYADLLVNKTEKGLPYLPGKTLKGLLREAAVTLNQLHPNLVKGDFLEEVFGEKPQQKHLDEEVSTKEAISFFSNGFLSQNLQQQIQDATKPFLYHVLSSTAINEVGQAKVGSLRQLEVTIPLTLYAQIEHFPNKEDYLKQLEYCMKYIKQIGLNRSRGLGRCQFSILKNS